MPIGMGAPLSQRRWIVRKRITILSGDVEAQGEHDRREIDLPHQTVAALVAGARDSSPVAGLSHNHYKYPARFSPKFVRAAIEAFTEPGDLLFDPFVGGGTTSVEALALGRSCIGVDISALATFVAETKVLLLTDEEIVELRAWASLLPSCISMTAHTVHFATGLHEGYYRNIESKRFWRVRKAVEQSLASTIPLSGNVEQVARCIVLRAAQWALDGRAKLPSIASFRETLTNAADTVISGSVEFRQAVEKAGGEPSFRCFNRSAEGIETVPEVIAAGAPRLVLTSPPYPGIHVLYHRWQVAGGKETPAPFLIANKLDGSGESYYTLGNRRSPGLKTYWSNLTSILTSTAKLANTNTTFVQVVAFSEPGWQLPRYLEVCEEAGLSEVVLPGLDTPDGRLWRAVPNRRWYADQMGSIPASQEVVLLHQLKAVEITQLPRLQPRSEPPADLLEA